MKFKASWQGNGTTGAGSRSERAEFPLFDIPFQGWEVNSHPFGEQTSYPGADGRRFYWGPHLGADCICEAGTGVYAIAEGVCVLVESAAGSPLRPRQWGHTIIVRHNLTINRYDVRLYSVYGHLTPSNRLQPGDQLNLDSELGEVAPANNPHNGWWPDAHLHLGLMLDLYDRYLPTKRLPGYVHKNDALPPERLIDWIDPAAFFEDPELTVERKIAEIERRDGLKYSAPEYYHQEGVIVVGGGSSHLIDSF